MAVLEGIHSLELEFDFFPEFASGSQFRTPTASFPDNVVTFAGQGATFVTSLDTSFQSHTVSGGTRCVTPGVAEGSTTEL
jgi:hypothetical protein